MMVKSTTWALTHIATYKHACFGHSLARTHSHFKKKKCDLEETNLPNNFTFNLTS